MKKVLPVLSSSPSSKTMMPEVLPDPRRPPGVTGPRHRTMAHMQRLLAAAATVGVAGGATSAVAVSAAGASAAGCGKSIKVPDATPDAETTTPENNGNTSGYAVVDPMPPPAHCPGVAQQVPATAKFVSSPSKELRLAVRLPLPKNRADYKYIKGASATSYGGKVLSTEVKPDAVTVVVELPPGATSASVTVKGICDAGPSSINANVSWTGEAKVGTAATINLNDMYDY